MSEQDIDLTRNYDFIQDLVKKVDGQATLLQINGEYKDSLEVYDRKVYFIRKTEYSSSVMNQTHKKQMHSPWQAITLNPKKHTDKPLPQKIKDKLLVHLAKKYMQLN